MDDVAAGQLSLRDFAATVPGLALRPGCGPLGGLARRTFGSAFAHSAALHAAAAGESEGGSDGEGESEGDIARALLGFGELSHFTDMDVLAQVIGGGGGSNSLGCHVFNASGLVQWGFGAESTDNVGQVVPGTSAVLQAALRN